MAIRVGSGTMKGRKVSAKAAGTSSHGDLRPTSSKVRESLFNIIAPDIKGAVFVDLYAGTGAVGIEAMSRGASMVYFVEADRRRAKAISDAIEGCGCRSKAVIVNSEASAFISKAHNEGTRFDIVFLDPPYDSGQLGTLVEMLGELPVLADDAMVVAEHRSTDRMPEQTGVLEMKKTYKYGDTTLTTMRRRK